MFDTRFPPGWTSLAVSRSAQRTFTHWADDLPKPLRKEAAKFMPFLSSINPEGHQGGATYMREELVAIAVKNLVRGRGREMSKELVEEIEKLALKLAELTIRRRDEAAYLELKYFVLEPVKIRHRRAA